MKCKKARDVLTAEYPGAAPAHSQQLARHLEGCALCRRYGEEMTAVRSELRNHRTILEPDGSFSARVLERLPRREPDQASDLLGWAALRLLPVALALALVLGAWSLLSSPSPETLLSSMEQDPIAWVLGGEAGGS